MLLVHHDEAEIGKGKKQCRPRAADNAHIALGHAAPCARPLLRGDGGMPLAGAASEARLEALEELARQRNFRQKDENLLLPAPQSLRDGFEINLGFS